MCVAAACAWWGRALLRLRLRTTVALQQARPQARPFPPCTNPHPPPNYSLQWFLEQHQMELGDDAEVKTAAKLAQQMAYQNKVGVCACGWVCVWVRGGSLGARGEEEEP